MVRLTISLDDDVHQKLKELAEEEDRTVSNLIGYLLKQTIRKEQNQSKAS